MREGSAFDNLRAPAPDGAEIRPVFSPHPSYEEYLKIHKTLVGPKTARQMERICRQLQNEPLAEYQSVAGWAATEAALAQPHLSASYRNALLEQAGQCWQTALERQLEHNAAETEHLRSINAAYYYALDLAHLPLLQALVSGDVTPAVRRQVRLDVLNIAQANEVQLRLALDAGDTTAIGEHVGVTHECNALLAIHSLDSAGLLAIPSSARADSGHYHRHQTHDLTIIQQRWGEILDMTPAEVKSKASSRDKSRYKAILVRGKMHLSFGGKYSSLDTLNAFAHMVEGTQSATDRSITDYVRQTVLDMYWLYKKGRVLDDVATSRSPLHYRDASTLQQSHPEIAPNK